MDRKMSKVMKGVLDVHRVRINEIHGKPIVIQKNELSKEAKLLRHTTKS